MGKDNRQSLEMMNFQYAEKPKTDVNIDIINSVPLSKECQKKFEVLSQGDDNPFEFVQELNFGENYPTTAKQIYTKNWAKQYAEHCNTTPIPGSKDGHTLYNKKLERVENHLYATAAKLVSNEKMLIRHYVTRDMPEYEYNKFIKEIKAGLVSTSVVSYNKKEYKQDKSGNVVVYVTDCLGNERNDAVEWNATGMSAKMLATSQKGIVNNIEYNIEDGGNMGDLAESIANIRSESEKLGVAGSVELAKKLGFEKILLSNDVKAKADKLDALTEQVGDLDTFINGSIESQKETFKDRKILAVQKAFPENKIAQDVVCDFIGEKPIDNTMLQKEIERVSGLESVKSIISQKFDIRDKTNTNINSEKEEIPTHFSIQGV